MSQRTDLEYVIALKSDGRMLRGRVGASAAWTEHSWNPRADLVAGAKIYTSHDEAYAEMAALYRNGYDCVLLWAPSLDDRVRWFNENKVEIPEIERGRIAARERAR